MDEIEQEEQDYAEEVLGVTDSGPEGECKSCGFVLAGIGLLISVVFAYISIDVFTNGGLTRSLGLGTAKEVIEDEG